MQTNIMLDFNEKFMQLSEENKRYIIAIQQALLFAQKTETTSGQAS